MSDQLVNLLAKRYVQRTDVKAWQQSSGAYIPDRSPITRVDLNAHLAGATLSPPVGTVDDGTGRPLLNKEKKPMIVQRGTMGHYLLGQDDKCKLFCFDIDLAASGVWDDQLIQPRVEFLKADSPYREGLTGQLVIAAEALARETHKLFEIPVAIAFSGAKGVHVYGFTGPDVAADVRAMAIDVLGSIGTFKPLRGANFFSHENPEMNVEIEVFPKQDSLDGKDLGNLLRLPLGINRKTGREGCFLKCGGGKRASFARMDSVEALSGVLPWQN